MKKYLVLLCSLFPFLASGQENNELYAREWRQADSLLDRGFPESAGKILDEVYRQAKANNQQVQMLKAQLYLVKGDFQKNEDAARDAILRAEREAATTPFPVKAVWQSIAAQLYWSYYAQNRWKILGRTRVGNEKQLDDLEQWDASRFFSKTASLYDASLARAEELKNVRISDYDPVLEKGANTRNLRPTLFDLLAFRALAYYQNDEKDVTSPTFAFVMDDEAAFAAAPAFIKKNFSSEDTASMQWRALKLYQQILSMHIEDASPDALIDADLHRLDFIFQHSVHPRKQELYVAALKQLEDRYSNNPLSAMASYKIAMQMFRPQQAGRKSVTDNYSDGPRYDYVAQKKKLESIVARFPESEGGLLARQQLQAVHFRYLAVKAEDVVLPGEASRLLLTYRNVQTVYFRVLPLTAEEYRLASSRYNDEKWKDKLLKTPPLKTWSEKLPGTEDLDMHAAEIKVDAMPPGIYAVIASSESSFQEGRNIIHYTPFQVSSVSLISSSGYTGGGKGFVLHRKTGKPIANAKVELYKEVYNRKTYDYDRVKTETFTTGPDGSFTNKANDHDSYNGVVVHSGNEHLYHYNYFSLTGTREQEERTTQRTFFFTDRSLYRPGQTIYFKGVVVSTSRKGKSNDVVANQEQEVVFYDANGQKITSVQVKTNEFGSFTGKFTTPESGLTGQMRIGSNNGSAYVSVEEYKRPKFFVSFDALKGTYALNDEIKMTGKAEAYAGNRVDGAAVKYRVVRNVVFPYYWLFWRYYGNQSFTEAEIANGTTITGKGGTFTVPFTATPDLSVDKSTMPTFHYTVYADVTDLNGETRSSSQSFNAGYTSVQLQAALPQRATPASLDTLYVRAQNLNGQYVKTEVNVRISLLKAPASVLRKRMWEAPDQYVMDEATFRQYFPNDEYREEASHLAWEKGTQVYEKQLVSQEDGRLVVGSGIWSRNGWYVVEMQAQDKSGMQVVEKKYVQVWDERNNGTLSEALMLTPHSQSREPGQQAKVQVVSGYPELHLLQQETDMETHMATKQINYNKPFAWTRQLSEADRGGVVVSYITVKENRVYQQTATVSVPWSNKNLQVSWETHRDKLLPGQKETWTMVVSGPNKEKVAAEMVAGMYDASLDAFKPHAWGGMSLFPYVHNRAYWNVNMGFGTEDGMQLDYYSQEGIPGYDKRYDQIFLLGDYGQYLYHLRYRSVSRSGAGAVYEDAAEAVPAAAPSLKFTPPVTANANKKERSESEDKASNVQAGINEGGAAAPDNNVAIRTNLNETAFFYPQLRTDANGNVRIEFTIPEALTEWKFMAMAHTTDMKTGMLEGRVKTQKDLMVVPGLPRFIRQNDELEISTKISNLSDKDLEGTATLSFLNALTMQPVDIPFRLRETTVPFKVQKGESTSATWKVTVPESMYEPVIVRIMARAGNFSDGEENALPVVSNRMMVTETMPLWIHGNGTKDFSFAKLKNSDTSKTLSQYKLTLEYTGNPAWYAVQALPYLMEYPYECAEQTFNRFYANALAAHIVEQSPKIEAIFRKWETESTEALLSNLEKNQELKTALLEETPWVMEAKNETEQKKRIAQLFETHKLSRGLNATMRKLKDMQLPEGAFPWFNGMYPDRYITQYILTGMGRLGHLGISDKKGNMNEVVEKALPYLDRKIKEDYDNLVKNKVKLDQQNIGYFEVQYLYMRSFYSQPVDKANQVAFNYYKGQAAKYWPRFNAYMKGMIALSLHRYKDNKQPPDIIASLKETAMKKEELGMSWMKPGYSYWWYEAPVEAQSLLIECFAEVAKDTADIDQMKVWLLKQKQTQNWHTTKATADACYALLLNGSEWLNNEPRVTVQMGAETIKSTEIKTQAGTGYFKTAYTGEQVKPGMGNIKVTVQDNAHSTSWGAVYWQYFEQMDKITSAATPLVVKKQLFIERNTNRGPELQEITDGNSLAIGDKVKARIEITVDRDMEYVHLKDMRASCFEPVNVLSGYRYQDGLGYYESTKDVSSNFFFGRLPKGKYVFEYPMFVTNKGDFSNGIATIQCMYAPEFSSHSEGFRVKVK
ncbi:MAG: alpha-2-macroglobulin [Flavipsychrobacter sp.]|nr:alpha-2-macroglobulin [Flavipsychrobacter sp.]